MRNPFTIQCATSVSAYSLILKFKALKPFFFLNLSKPYSTTHFDPYVILGIKKTATKAEIKAAYKEQVFIYHPDRKPKNPEQFLLISKAYKLLSSPLEKKAYDSDQTQTSSKHTHRPYRKNTHYRYNNYIYHNYPNDASTYPDQGNYNGPNYMSNNKFAIMVLLVGLSTSCLVYYIGFRKRVERYNEMMKTQALVNEQREGLRIAKLKRNDNREKEKNGRKLVKEKLSIEEQRKMMFQELEDRREVADRR